MKLPRSLCRTSSTICGRSSANPRTAPLIACTTASTTAPMTITIPSTSTVEHSARLQPNRRSIAFTTGKRTATLKTETKIMSRTSATETSAHATATVAATSRIVRIDIEASTSGRPVSLAPRRALPRHLRTPSLIAGVSARRLRLRLAPRAGGGSQTPATSTTPSISAQIPAKTSSTYAFSMKNWPAVQKARTVIRMPEISPSHHIGLTGRSKNARTIHHMPMSRNRNPRVSASAATCSRG